MSKNVGVFVDVANLYYAAKSAGVDVDYVTLLKGAVRGRDLIRAYAYSGLDPENENQRKFIEFLSKNGYKVVVKDIRKYGDGKIKANLDIELVVDLFRLADRMDAAVIISGDGDFAPAIRALQDKGVRAEVISFRGNTSSDLISVADEFIDIMKVVQVGRTKKDAVVAPEMPAKEVTPEFSFREAPPGVAAAARAALRTGGRTGGRASARRAPGEPPPVLAVAVGSEAEALAERGEVPFDEEELVATAGEPPASGSRRRRRRGGRGRGRSRGDAAQRAEPGADEFDALSTLDLGEEREYAFSEADPETLAELGLLVPGSEPEGGVAAPAPAVAPAAGAESEGEASTPRTRRSRRGGRTAGRGEAAELPGLVAEPPAESPPAAPVEAGLAAEPPAEAKPRARRRRSMSGAGAETATDTSTADTVPQPGSRGRTRAPRSGRTRQAEPTAPAAGEGGAAASEAQSARRGRSRGRPSGDAEGARSPQGAARRPRQPRRVGGQAASGGEKASAVEAAGAPPAEPLSPPAQPSGAESARGATEGGAHAEGGDGSQPRGIWQRLLSGRKN